MTRVAAWPLIMAGDKWPLPFLLPSWYPSVVLQGERENLYR